jgi:alkylresorcinol/alkylpyrone synthase
MQRTVHLTASNGVEKPATNAALPALVSSSVALTDNVYTQEELIEAFNRYWEDQDHNPALLRRFFESVRVERRHFALRIEEYPPLAGFTESNQEYLRVGTDLAERALSEALESAGVKAEDLNAIFFTTVTGVAVPTIDARLANRLGFRSDIKRTPLFGLGCVAGAAGVARMADYLRAFPEDTAALVSVELCSLTLQKRDRSIPAIVAGGLFGDGAAAVIGAGSDRVRELGASAPSVIASRSSFYPNTEYVMGWDVGSDGFKVVLSADVPAMVGRYLKRDVEKFLEDHGLSTDDIGCWICHPGGPKVLEAMETELRLPPGALDVTWRSLADVGNLSSASVLHVLSESVAQGRMKPGMFGLMAAMGPGFCSELVLLRW